MNMEKVRENLRKIVFDPNNDWRLVDPIEWQAAYEHIPGTDVTADAITIALADLVKEKQDIELLRQRAEAEGD